MFKDIVLLSGIAGNYTINDDCDIIYKCWKQQKYGVYRSNRCTLYVFNSSNLKDILITYINPHYEKECIIFSMENNTITMYYIYNYADGPIAKKILTINGDYEITFKPLKCLDLTDTYPYKNYIKNKTKIKKQLDKLDI